MVSSSRFQRPIRPGLVAGALAAGAIALLSGCSAMVADNMPAAIGGLPADAPARPVTSTAFPAVHSMPPGMPPGMPPVRTSTPLSADQQKQLEDDLVAARDRNNVSPDAPPPTETAANPAPNPKAGSARNP
jgi:hypothetical protein